jgi:hypothetical protein
MKALALKLPSALIAIAWLVPSVPTIYVNTLKIWETWFYYDGEIYFKPHVASMVFTYIPALLFTVALVGSFIWYTRYRQFWNSIVVGALLSWVCWLVIFIRIFVNDTEGYGAIMLGLTFAVLLILSQVIILASFTYCIRRYEASINGAYSRRIVISACIIIATCVGLVSLTEWSKGQFMETKWKQYRAAQKLN